MAGKGGHVAGWLTYDRGGGAAFTHGRRFIRYRIGPRDRSRAGWVACMAPAGRGRVAARPRFRGAVRRCHRARTVRMREFYRVAALGQMQPSRHASDSSICVAEWITAAGASGATIGVCT
ncbi:hypothetical protein MyNCGM683_01430 [Achromobacter xylosoxidans]